MAREITIRLDDEQYDALVAAAEAAGEKFYAHCRRRLMERLTTAVPAAPVARRLQAASVPVPTGKTEGDRLDRLETMFAQFVERVESAMSGRPEPGDWPREDQPVEGEAPDVDDMVAGALDAAERQGLTAVHEAPARPASVRALARPRTPFTPGSHHVERAGFGPG